MKKIFIIGTSGSGKSYLAKILSKKYKIKHFDLDDIFWENKYTKKRSEENKKEISKIIKQDKGWIFEGVFTSFIKEIVNKTDEIIWLDINKNVLSYRILKRYFKNRKNPDETFKSNYNLMKWARNYKK